MVSMGRRRFGTDFQLMFRILKGLLFLGFVSVMTVLFVVCGLSVSDLFAAVLAFLPTGWALLLVSSNSQNLHIPKLETCSRVCDKSFTLMKFIVPLFWLICFSDLPNKSLSPYSFQIAQACRPMLKGVGFWDSIKELARAYEYIMGLAIFSPVVILSWFPFVSEFQTRLLFNQAFSRGLQISMILAGRKDRDSTN